jgi:ketosteroid isomerase-like protein
MSDLFKLYEDIVVALRAGDDIHTLTYFHPDFVVHEDPGMPYGGEFKGGQAFIDLRHKVKKFWNLAFIARCADQDGRHFVAVFKATGVEEAPTQGLETVVTVVWTFEGGQALEARVIYFDTPRMAAAIARG